MGSSSGGRPVGGQAAESVKEGGQCVSGDAAQPSDVDGLDLAGADEGVRGGAADPESVGGLFDREQEWVAGSGRWIMCGGLSRRAVVVAGWRLAALSRSVRTERVGANIGSGRRAAGGVGDGLFDGPADLLTYVLNSSSQSIRSR
jgi:hypothetical protein